MPVDVLVEHRLAALVPAREQRRLLGAADAGAALPAVVGRPVAEREVVAVEVHARADRPVVVRREDARDAGAVELLAEREREAEEAVDVRDVGLELGDQRARGGSACRGSSVSRSGCSGSLKRAGRL